MRTPGMLRLYGSRAAFLISPGSREFGGGGAEERGRQSCVCVSVCVYVNEHSSQETLLRGWGEGLGLSQSRVETQAS